MALLPARVTPHEDHSAHSPNRFACALTRSFRKSEAITLSDRISGIVTTLRAVFGMTPTL